MTKQSPQQQAPQQQAPQPSVPLQQVPPKPARRAWTFYRLLPALIVIGVLAGGWVLVQTLTSRSPDPHLVETAAPEATEGNSAEEITLSDTKLAEASVTTQRSCVRRIADVRTVSGRLTYDEAHHIEVKAPVSGILVDVLVKPGDNVTKDQLLAVINSPEIGTARAAVFSEQARFKMVLRQLEQLDVVAANTRDLFVQLSKNRPLSDIEQQFDSRSLGSYRQEIIAAWSERLLAEQLSTAARPLVDSGSLPLRTLREREHDSHVAAARFQAVRETTEWDLEVRSQQLKAERENAEHQVMIAKNHLNTLLGLRNDDDSENEPTTSDALSRMEVHAPFSGTIESRHYAKQERVEPSDSLFVLADTRSLYVAADIRENEWSAMSVGPGTEIPVIVPAIPDRTFVATVHYIGRSVMPDSHSLPLVATISNAEGQLRPGMFVRVSIPVAESDDVVTVPAESVMQHENRTFVFVAMNDLKFRRVDVQTGRSNEQWIEIRDGLPADQPVVARGAFVLKSELLLAGEQ